MGMESIGFAEKLIVPASAGFPALALLRNMFKLKAAQVTLYPKKTSHHHTKIMQEIVRFNFIQLLSLFRINHRGLPKAI
jgi:hypothetical protein